MSIELRKMLKKRDI